MIKKILFLTFVCFIIISCEQSTPLPVKEEDLVKVLRDIHIAESAMQNLVGITKDSIGDIYYQQVLELHGVEKAAFDSSMVLLRKEPAKLGLIYDKIIVEMDMMSDSLFQY